MATEGKTEDGSPTVKPVWIDCDPGHDDAFALILAAYHPGLKLIGVSTVHGNVDVERTTRNALQTLYLSGVKGVDVVKGAGKPLMRPSRVCPEIHGECGLGGHDLPDLPADVTPVEGPAVTAMFTRIKAAAADSPVTLIATGCLTNVALLLSVYPEVVDYLAGITIMGGAIGAGNTHPVCEFNIQVDPEAARIVFSSGIRVGMVPLEVTHTALVTKSVLDRIDALGSGAPFAKVVHNWLLFFASTYDSVFGMPDPPLHDPCAVALVVAPELFETRVCHVDIETSSPLSAGQTVCDLINIRRREDEKNATVALKMDVDAFWDVMISAVEEAVTRSPMNTAD